MTQAITADDIYSFLPAGSFARFAEIDWDADEFADGTAEGRRRKVKRIIKRSATAPINIRHNFVLGTLDSAAGNTPPLHAHDHPEIFIPVCAGYRISYGTDARNSVDLGLYDAISVPQHVLRLFESTEQDGRESQMLSIFDTNLENFHEGITVTPELRAYEISAGIPYHPDEQVSTAMVDIDPHELNDKYVARYAELSIEQQGDLRIRRLIAAADSRAALRTPHNIAVDYIEVPAGKSSQAYQSDCREVFIALEGQTQIIWNDNPIAMERLDILTVAPSDRRVIAAAGAGAALMLRIRDLTNTQ